MKNKDFLFDLTTYIELISKYKQFVLVKDYRKFSRGLILRHDVDTSFDLAYEVYKAEKEAGAKSTYYILLTSDLYNAFSIQSRKNIDEMISDGFEIGLHFDPVAYGDLTDEELAERFGDEVEMFRKITGHKFESFSFHNPSVHGRYPKIKGMINAYNPEIFNDDSYISDSVFSFRGKNPYEFLEKSKSQIVQFLTHAEHFFSEKKVTYENTLNSIVNNYILKLDEFYQVNKVYVEQKPDYTLNTFNKIPVRNG